MTKKEKFSQLKKEMEEDMTLPLREGATNLVLGEGNLDSEMFFIGEGPGYWEDQKGRPFVGVSGKFLDQLLSSIKLIRMEGLTTGGSKNEVFISNVVCFRPPSNRDPESEEIAAFQPYVDRLIEIIKPKVIVTLGRFSMGKFIPGVKISAVHGKVHIVNWKGSKVSVVPMYHPAAGLRRGEIKLQTIEDFKTLPGVLRQARQQEEKNIKQMTLV